MKPLLSAELTDPGKLKFPVVVSPKFDGIRALVVDGQLVSRTLKPIPNNHIRKVLSIHEFNGLDGELIAGNTFSETSSAVMSHDGEPGFEYHVFDDFTHASAPYLDRFSAMVRRLLLAAPFDRVSIVWPRVCMCWEEISAYHNDHITAGYEGTMIRHVDGVYKFGRSTEREGILLKLKQFKDTEAVVVGFEELITNNNEAKKDNLGRTKRGHSKKNLIPAGTLGALILEHAEFGIFNVGTGFSAAQRREIWDNQNDYIGKFAKVRYQPDGMVNKPRIPSFEGFRDPIDMGDL